MLVPFLFGSDITSGVIPIAIPVSFRNGSSEKSEQQTDRNATSK
jgi:hypothetical protein